MALIGIDDKLCGNAQPLQGSIRFLRLAERHAFVVESELGVGTTWGDERCLAGAAEQSGLCSGIRWGLPRRLARAIDEAMRVDPVSAPAGGSVAQPTMRTVRESGTKPAERTVATLSETAPR